MGGSTKVSAKWWMALEYLLSNVLFYRVNINSESLLVCSSFTVDLTRRQLHFILESCDYGYCFKISKVLYKVIRKNRAFLMCLGVSPDTKK